VKALGLLWSLALPRYTAKTKPGSTKFDCRLLPQGVNPQSHKKRM
jgi:hypothetical protein